MSFHGVQNDGRVRKIVETLDLIEKSARSNRVGPDDERAMLEPAFAKLAEMGWHLREGSARPGDPKVPAWVSIRTAAEEASLADLTYAMAVYLNRIDEHLKSEGPRT